MIDFLYVDCDSTVLLVARNRRAKDRIRQEPDNYPMTKLGPAYVMDPQNSLVLRHVLQSEGFHVLTHRDQEVPR